MIVVKKQTKTFGCTEIILDHSVVAFSTIYDKLWKYQFPGHLLDSPL